MISGVGICRPWPLLLVIVSLSCCASSIPAARHRRDRASPAVVVGIVFCDTCFQQAFSRDSHYISGATVAVECGLESSGPAFYQEVKTNNRGMFRVALPFSVTKQVKEIKGCLIKLLKSGEPYCPVATTSNSTSIHFKERKKGKHIFSAGFFTFKPIKQPGLCHQQPAKHVSRLSSLPGFFPGPIIPTLPPLNPIIPIGLNIPPIPKLPDLPQLPPLPPLPPLPRLPSVPYFNVIPQEPSNPSGKSQVKRGEVSEAQFFFSPIIGSPPSDIVPPNLVQPPPSLPDPSQSLTPFVPDPSQSSPPLVPDPSQVPPPLVPNPFLPDPSQSPPPLVPDPSQSPPPPVPDPSQVPSPLVPNPFLPPSPPTLLPPVPLFPSLPNLTPVLIIPGLTLASPPPPSLASFPIPPTPFSPESTNPSPPTLASPEKVNP